MWVFLVPKMPTASCGPFFPLRHRHGTSNGHGTAQETVCMDGCVVSALFPANYDAHRVAATPHFSEHRLCERGRSYWTSSPGRVSHGRTSSCNLRIHYNARCF